MADYQLSPSLSKNSAFKKRTYLLLVIIGILGMVSACFGVAYWRSQADAARLKTYATPQLEAERLIAEVGALMTLPNETPAIATVEDKQKLQGQSFFKNTKDG